MKEKKTEWTVNGVFGLLITKEKYLFVDRLLIAEIVRDVFTAQKTDPEKL